MHAKKFASFLHSRTLWLQISQSVNDIRARIISFVRQAEHKVLALKIGFKEK